MQYLNLSLDCSNVFNWAIVWICMNKNGFFTGIIIVVVLLVVGFFWFTSQMEGDRETEEDERCVSDDECVPASGCHPSKCINQENYIAPSEQMFCSTVCSGPLDCGAGSCGCVNDKCEIVPADNE